MDVHHSRRPRPSKREDFALYRFYDDAGRLLYVGQTNSLLARLVEHSLTKPWWWNVTAVRVEHFNGRADLMSAEESAIITENPVHNVKSNEALDEESLAYLGEVADWGESVTPRSLSRAMGAHLGHVQRILTDLARDGWICGSVEDGYLLTTKGGLAIRS